MFIFLGLFRLRRKFMEKIQIDNINFVPIRPTDTLIGFSNLRIMGWLELNSFGVHKNPDGSIRITLPARKLVNGTVKFYFTILDPGIEEQIREAIEAYIEDSGIWSAKTKVEEISNNLRFENHEEIQISKNSL